MTREREYLAKKDQERQAGSKRMLLTGVMMEAGTSVNGRLFSKEVMQKAVEEAQEKVRAGQMHGTIEPTNPELRLADISHKVTKLDVSAGRVYATIETVDTPKGRVLEEMLSSLYMELVPEGIVGSRAKDGTITEMKLTGVSIVRPKP